MILTILRVLRLKLLLVSSLLTVSLLLLVVIIDLLMGIHLSEVMKEAINPFRVMEPGEYVVVILFILYIVIKSVYSILKKKYAETSNQNEAKK